MVSFSIWSAKDGRRFWCFLCISFSCTASLVDIISISAARTTFMALPLGCAQLLSVIRVLPSLATEEERRIMAACCAKPLMRRGGLEAVLSESQLAAGACETLALVRSWSLKLEGGEFGGSNAVV